MSIKNNISGKTSIICDRSRAETRRSKNGKKTPIRIIKFGSVEVTPAIISRAEINRNIRAGQTAFRSIKSWIITPGVKIKKPRGHHLFAADPKDPNFIVRKRGSLSERGQLISGEFVRK